MAWALQQEAKLPKLLRKKRIGEVIKTARVRRGLKAEDVAKICNVSRSRVYLWEADSYVFPKNLPALSLALQIPISRLKAVNGERAAAG